MNFKLLFITHQLSRTGAPIVFLDMLRVLKDAGCFVDVISLRDGELREDFEAAADSLRIRDDFLETYSEFLVEAMSYDAVLVNTLVAYLPVLILNHSNVPVIWWLHEGIQYFDILHSIAPDFDFRNLKKNIHVFSVGHYVRDIVLQRFAVETDILPFGIKNVSHGKEGTAVPGISQREMEVSSGFFQEKDPRHKRVRYVTAGLYSSAKAQNILAEAIRLLPEDVLAQCLFVFCGDEIHYEEDVLRPVKDLEKCMENVRTLGSVPRQEVMSLLCDADFCLVPSRIDPIPTIAVEAMMQDTPCVITSVCGVVNYLKDGINALICPPDDPKTMAMKIIESFYLKNNKFTEYVEMTKQAHEVYENNFSFEVFAPRILSVLESCIIGNQIERGMLLLR